MDRVSEFRMHIFSSKIVYHDLPELSQIHMEQHLEWALAWHSGFNFGSLVVLGVPSLSPPK